MRTVLRRFTAPIIMAVFLFAGMLWIIGRLGFAGPNAAGSGYSADKIWSAMSCRAGLYLQKAEGAVPEVSWTDLWTFTRLSHGFRCSTGRNLAANLQYSESAGQSDLQEGARLFHERCTGCHGADGSGGPFGPSLIGSHLATGDSDLAIYQVLRNGRPGTAMRPIDLAPPALLKVTAYVAMLSSRSTSHVNSRAARPSIGVDSKRLQAAGTRTDEWLTYSGSFDGARHTTLAQITPKNVSSLRIKWVRQFDTHSSNIEATPLVVDGVMFFTPDARHVLALDVSTGDVIWEYKPTLSADLRLGYGEVNRGLAIWGKTLFLGSVDGHLDAINANDGSVVWQAVVADPSDGYSITVAPLVVGGLVVVGVSGGDYGIRGFLAAYDVATGKLQWKFYTIPGPGEAGHETWGNDAWRKGGGATWVTGSYDPTSDLLYWGVGNPGPDFDGDVRPGDNLFTNSVIALHASTGKLAWYFQFTPHDEHDWDSAQTPILADLLIKGARRKVILWPNRNGFFYVLDRMSGEFLAGVPFVETDWAKALTATGRPIVTASGAVTTTGRRTKPGINGGVNWQNPAFDPNSGTVFIPAVESSSVFSKAYRAEIIGGRDEGYLGSGTSQSEPGINEVIAVDGATGGRKWQHSTPRAVVGGGGHGNSDYSGLLSTGGGLVFGASGGVVFALDADSGQEVWHLPLGGTTKSPPISFTIDGHQVIAVAAGRALFVLSL